MADGGGSQEVAWCFEFVSYVWPHYAYDKITYRQKHAHEYV